MQIYNHVVLEVKAKTHKIEMRIKKKDRKSNNKLIKNRDLTCKRRADNDVALRGSVCLREQKQRISKR
jgi:hypothetical protein